MILSLIAAVASNGVIGKEGRLPWHLPDDLKHFKAVTLGHPVIMGRRTFTSMGKPLFGRRNLVVSRLAGPLAAGVDVVGSLDRALAACADAEEAFVIGGASLYREALPRARRLYLTRVDAEIAGDVYFPDWDPSAWRLLEESSHPADARHPYPFRFQRYERV